MTQSPNRGLSSLHTLPIAITGLMVSIALIFSYLEVLLPFNIGVPGIKLGVANIVIIVTLYYFNGKYAMIINIVRIFISGLLFSGVFGIIYSLAGGLLSLLTMILLKRVRIFSVTGVSIAGGVMHNLGQMLIASILVGNSGVFIYFPVLVISGVVCGFVTGVISFLILRYLPSRGNTL